MKKQYLVTALTAAAVCILAICAHALFAGPQKIRSTIKIGFIYDSDESTPYTMNFIRAQNAVAHELGDQAEILVQSNVPEQGDEQAIRDLAEQGCDLIFISGYGEAALRIAADYPEIQICQASGGYIAPEAYPENYHTFMGAMYQGRYITGVIAGMKMREMINKRIIAPNEAKAGYVAAFSNPEVISGYTAFLLGIRTVVPEAVLHVRYTDTWSSYTLEKAAADALIAEGCVIISQHSDTIGPAVACEEAQSVQPVYHIGYNQSMLDIAPMSSLLSARINWVPYILGAAEAVQQGKKIERSVSGNVNGNDIGAGIAEGWIDIMDLNTLIAAEDSQETIDRLIAEFRSGTVSVFQGDYLGVDPEHPEDTCDLHTEYIENAGSSAPTFHYILQDAVIIDTP